MKKPTLNIKSAFSLVELLVVIAVIAIIAAIAIPNIANITAGATTAKNQRNAQNIASVFNAAVAAGYNPTGIATAAAAADAVAAGIDVTVSGGETSTFRADGISAADQTTALTYLTLANQGTPRATLSYSQTAGGGGGGGGGGE